MSSDAVVRRLIEDLRALAAECESPFDPHSRLVDALEWMLADPGPRGWNVVLTGEDAHDRLALAEWLDCQATGPAFTSPVWGRGFSQLVAWTLRHGHPVTGQGMRRASKEMLAARRLASQGPR